MLARAALLGMTTTMASKTENLSLKCEGNSDSNVLISDFKDKFYMQLKDFYSSQSGTVKKPWTNERVLEVIMFVKTGKVAMDSGVRRNPMQYYWCKKYDVINVNGEDCLIFKTRNPEDQTTRVIPMEQYFDILMEVHKKSGHGGRDKMQHTIKNKVYIQRKAIEIFVSLCPSCESKRSVPKKSIVMKPISKDFYRRGQVDLIDLHTVADGDYKWLLNYQDHDTKFLQLRPLRSEQATDVAEQLIDIFLTFGAPCILQSGKGREFTAEVIEQVMKVWPECKIVHGSPRSPQTQGSVERSNEDIENMLRIWMRENNSTNWSLGCKFVQNKKNASHHRVIGRSPYSALFGCDPTSGLHSTNIPQNSLQYIQAEEDLENIIDVETNDGNNKQAMNNISEVKSKNSTITQSSTIMVTNNMISIESLENNTKSNITKNDKSTCISTQLKNTVVSDDVENGSGEEQTYETNDCDGSYDAGTDNIKIETAYSSPTEFVEVETKPHETVETPPHVIKKRKLMKKRISTLRQERQTGQPSSSIPSGIEPIALVWSSKLQTLQPTQRLLAEKAINDVLFEASLNTLTRTSVVINATEPECVNVEVPEEYIEYTYTDQDE